ncbi:phage terminase small subunit [Sphaerotilus natans]|uniref:terminase small subunit n=1 Tax=Sphaerotilus natans TaxID=34103 RepID=UPI00069034CC|nr:terminase small subunit [Sphaerotilus natans]SIQ07862.1 phage terminase small subunit [Sphaerotilus natans]
MSKQQKTGKKTANDAPAKKVKPKPKRGYGGSVIETAHESGVLTSAMEVFAQKLAETGNRSEAYRAAYPDKASRWTPQAIHVAAARLAASAKVALRVSEIMSAAARAAGATAEGVLRQYMRVLQADPRRLVSYRRGACRHCYGKGHRYQFTPAEFEDAQLEHQAKQQKNPALPDFDPKGGVGYNPKRQPNPDCPECFGDGRGRVVVHDTDGLGVNEAALYEGVKVSKDGIEVLMADRMVALSHVARHVGFYKEDNEQGPVVSFDAADLDARFAASISESVRRQEALREERRKLREGRDG